MQTISPIEKASRQVGGLTKLANILGVAVPTVHEWKTNKRRIPAAHCKGVVLAAKGEVTLQELRPDDWQKYWPELAQPTTPTAQAAESVAQK